MIVSRRPQRFDEMATLIESMGFACARRSTADGTPRANEIWLGDSLGEMALYYGLADVALLGGSFEPLGGQNLIEAAACACPVILGPSTFNFAEAAELAIAAGAALRVDDMMQAVVHALALVADKQRSAGMAQAAQVFAASHRGAAERTVTALLALARQVPEAPLPAPVAEPAEPVLEPVAPSGPQDPPDGRSEPRLD